MNYDASKNNSDEDYFAFTKWLKDKTAQELKMALGDVGAIKKSITDYLYKGYSAKLTSGQLVDYFCVSAPSILDEAGYFGEEADAVIRLYDEINPEIFSKFYPLNP